MCWAVTEVVAKVIMVEDSVSEVIDSAVRAE